MKSIMNFEKTSEITLTLEKVKEVILPFKDSPIYTSLNGLCECWFGIAKNQEKTDEEAALITMENLRKELLKFSNP